MSGQTFRDYLYVSDAKLDMLIAQMPRTLREKFDITVSLGALGAGADISMREPATDRFTRVEKVCAALEKDGQIGDVLDADANFFRATMLSTWGFFSRSTVGYADVVFFTGFPSDAVLVGVGGSAYHTMERASDRLQQYSNSGLQGLMGWLKERSELKSEAEGAYSIPGAWDYETSDADHDNPLEPERIEFVATRLRDATNESELRVIIGSPLYVARVGPATSRLELDAYSKLRNAQLRRVYERDRIVRTGEHWQVGKPAPAKEPPFDAAINKYVEPPGHAVEQDRTTSPQGEPSRAPVLPAVTE